MSRHLHRQDSMEDVFHDAVVLVMCGGALLQWYTIEDLLQRLR
jgi:hypothetical protein